MNSFMLLTQLQAMAVLPPLLYSAVKLLSHMNACSCGGCDFSEFDCMCAEKCYLILVEPVEGRLGG